MSGTSNSEPSKIKNTPGLPPRRSQGRFRVRALVMWAVGLGVVAAIVVPALLSARPTVSDDARLAPDFMLTDTSGESVSLSDYRGQPVILYFNEGAGCEACIIQMKVIESDPAFAAQGIVVLPIVMDPPDYIRAAMDAVRINTPFLIDDGTVSEEYGTLGTGMHAGLPGHGFILINAAGEQVWSGDYPSMWLEPKDLLVEVNSRL